MDTKTLAAYSANALEYSQDWLTQPEPLDIYKLLRAYFKPGLITADIGCGNGRDTNWLFNNGFKVVGYDSTPELLSLARALYPKIKFAQAFLPSLLEIDQQFDNVFCETVIMHLPKTQVLEGLNSLKRILSKNGVLYLSWRVTEGVDTRHKDGRLYSAFEPEFILREFRDFSILHFEDKVSESSGRRVCRLIVSRD